MRRCAAPGLDYHEMASVREHADLAACLAAVRPARVFALTTSATRSVYDARFARATRSCSGRRRAGCRRSCSTRFAPELRLRIPMRAGNRSLNLSNAAAVTVYEAWRQLGFAGSATQLGADRPAHQRRDRGARIRAFVQHSVELLDDRHRHLVLLRDAMHGARAVVALDDLPDRAQRFGRRGAAGEREPEAAVARLVVRAGRARDRPCRRGP